MWADAQRDGRPAEYRWRPLRKFRNFIPCIPRLNVCWRPLLECRAVNAASANIGQRKTWTQNEFCSWQNSVRRQGPQMCIYSVPAQETAEDRVKFCWPPLSDIGAVAKPRRVQRISDMHSKFALRPHHVWKYGRHPVWDGWDKTRKKRRKKKPQDENVMSASTTQCGHNLYSARMSKTSEALADRER